MTQQEAHNKLIHLILLEAHNIVVLLIQLEVHKFLWTKQEVHIMVQWIQYEGQINLHLIKGEDQIKLPLKEGGLRYHLSMGEMEDINHNLNQGEVFHPHGKKIETHLDMGETVLHLCMNLVEREGLNMDQ